MKPFSVFFVGIGQDPMLVTYSAQDQAHRRPRFMVTIVISANRGSR